MTLPARLGFVIAAAAVCSVLAPASARADETDNFTCRARVLADALDTLDAWMNVRISEAIAQANRRGPAGCDGDCLRRELQRRVGASSRHPLTGIPHATLARRVQRGRDIDRCHLAFRESIYGARPYNQPWLYPINGRVIFLADTINLSGRYVGTDKINHFMREGLAHWRAVDRGADLAGVMTRELGPPGRQLRWNERGLKGLTLTGVLAWADLAASYSGFLFWSDLLAIDGGTSLIVFDALLGRFVQQRPFTFAAYVNDAWDEAINVSTFHPGLAREVAAALWTRSMTSPVTGCQRLADLPDARLFVNPSCRAPAADVTGR
jgi:hypothetical protein